MGNKLQRNNVCGSRPLLAIDNIELYLLAFPQGLEAVTLNSRKMYKHVLAFF